MNRTDEAIKLFKEEYGKTPQESGFPVIDIYEKQHAFLYADSEETIKAYKTNQNIVRGIWIWGMWPLLIAFLVGFTAMCKSQDFWHPLCIASYIVYGICLVSYIVLGIKANKAEQLFKLDDNITYLNY